MISALLAGNYQTVNGLYIDTLQSVSGCDSILRTELIIDTVVYSTTDLELCYGDSALFGGVYYAVSGIYSDTLQAQAGCDVSIFNLTVRGLNYTYADSINICFGDSSFLGGDYQISNGIYYDTLLSQFGCDSIIETYLNIKPVSFVQDYLSICNSDSVFLEVLSNRFLDFTMILFCPLMAVIVLLRQS